MENEILTISQTATYLQISDKTVRRLINDGKLRASKLSNRTWRIRLCDIESYLQDSSNYHGVPAKQQPIVINNNQPRLIS